MTNNSSNSTSSNKAKLQSLKTEVASSLNVNLKQGYNGISPPGKPVLSAAKW